MDEFYQTFQEELMPVLKLLQKIEEVGTVPNLFYEASITLIPKQDKETTRKENDKLISLMIKMQNTGKPNSLIKRIIYH